MSVTMMCKRYRVRALRGTSTGAVLGALLVLVSAAAARAEALPFQAKVQVGRPPRALTVRITGAHLEASRPGGPTAKVDLPVDEPQSADSRTIRMPGGAAVALIHVEGGGESAAALVTLVRGAPTVVWSGRTDLHGDPGERHAGVVEVLDQGKGTSDVLVGQTREETHICGQDATLLSPRRLDPRSLALEPAARPALPAAPPDGQQEVTARLDSPGPTGAPVLQGLSFAAASSSESTNDPGLVPPPTALVDGDASTAWVAHGEAGSRSEFATATVATGSFPIRALALVLGPKGGSAAVAHAGRLRTFWLVGDRGPRLHVTVPDDPAKHPGQPYWVVPDQPLHWHCMSIVVGDTYGAGDAAAIAEVAAYTDLDFGQGIARLVSGLDAPGTAGSEAADLLGRTGTAGVQALAKAWNGLSPRARKRAVRALRVPALTSPQARALLVSAARHGDQRTRKTALRTLAEAGSRAGPALAQLVSSGGELADRAALALAHADPVAATDAILSAMSAHGGSERPALRRALQRAVRDGGPSALARVKEFAEHPPSVSGAAAAALALSGLAPAGPLVRFLIASNTPNAQRFEDRWRLVAAAGDAPADPGIDRWLVQVATNAPEWMLRAAALEALAHRNPAEARKLAAQAFKDAYPRVRATAVARLGAAPDEMIPVATLARRDPWPLVRQAAVRALQAHPRALPVVRAAVHDPAAAVRVTSIETLTQMRDRAAWPKVEDRLSDTHERDRVRSAAIAYAHQLCVKPAVPALATIVDQALDPNADMGAVELGAEAVGGLTALGGPKARAVLEKASGPRAPGLLRTTAKLAAEHEKACR